jgi:hypothetical protein
VWGAGHEPLRQSGGRWLRGPGGNEERFGHVESGIRRCTRFCGSMGGAEFCPARGGAGWGVHLQLDACDPEGSSSIPFPDSPAARTDRRDEKD